MQHAPSCWWKLHLLLLAAVLTSHLVGAARPAKVFDHVPQASPVFLVRDALVAQCQDFHWDATDLCSGAVPYTRLGMKSALCQKHYWCTPDGGACVTTCPQGEVFDSSCQCCREFDAINSIVFFNDQRRTCNWLPRDLPPKPAEALAPVQPAPAAAPATPGSGALAHSHGAGSSEHQKGVQGARRFVQEPPMPTLLVALGAAAPSTPGIPQPQSRPATRVPLAVYEPPSSSYTPQRAVPSAKAQALTKAIVSEQRRHARAARRVAAAAADGGQAGHTQHISATGAGSL